MLRTFIRAPTRLLRNYNAAAQLAKLRSHRNETLRAIGEAISESRSNSVSDEERDMIDAIEQRRSSLLASSKTITVIDYGAASDSTRTKEDMARGVQSRARVADVCKASRQPFWGCLLFKLVRKLKPLSCVELGACVGISASYQAAALNINGQGSLITIEGSPEVAGVAKETIEALNLHDTSVVIGRFIDTLEDVLQSARPVDFFFNDGHHDHDAVIEYFNQTVPYLAERAVIVFDDISWSPGMRKAWTRIEDDERVSASIDLKKIGIAVLGEGLQTREAFRIHS